MHDRTRAILEKVISDEIKVVSFDIFDTLLVRPVINPTDLFKLVEYRSGFDRFKDMRIIAERSARKKKPFYEDDITFDDIYNEFEELFCVSEEIIAKLKETELQVELDYLTPRKTLREIFNAAKEHDKEVIITSDMYLPKSFLEMVLEKNGYTGYNRFYLSSEDKLTKGSGRLFAKIIADYEAKGVSPSEILHIGDNKNADIGRAQQYRIQACHVPSTISILKSKKRLAHLFENHPDMDNTFLVGYIANTLFDDPFYPFDINSYFGEKTENMGVILFAPLLFVFTKWMLEDSIREDVDKLSFVYRDGYIPLEIYNKLAECYKDAPETVVFYLTRAMRCNYFAKEKNGLYKVFKDLPPSRNMTVVEFVKNRLLVEDADEQQNVLEIFERYGLTADSQIGDLESNISIFNEIEPYFSKNASTRIDELDRYWNTLFSQKEKFGVFDVGYRGSASRFLTDYYGVNNVGYHLFATSVINSYISNKEYNLKSFIQYGIAMKHQTKILHPLIEDIISVQEGSVTHVRYNDDGFEYIGRDRDIHYNEEIEKIQKIIIQFSEGFVSLFRTDLPKLMLDGYPFFYFMIEFLKNPFHKDAKLLAGWTFEESQFISSDNITVYKQWYNQRMNRNRNKVQVRNRLRLREHFKANPEKSKLRIIIYLLLLKMGLLPSAKKVLAPLLYWLKKPEDDPIIKELEEGIAELQKVQFDLDGELILVAGHMVSFNKGMCHYLNQISRKLINSKLLLLCEATRVDITRTKKLIDFDFIKVPKLFGKNEYRQGVMVKVGKEITERIKQKEYLSLAVDNIRTRNPDMGKGYAEALIYYSELYFREVIKKFKPKKVILWNQFHALHFVWHNVCEEMGVKTVYMEFGVLPGTIGLEETGQMGESLPAIEYKKFLNLQVNDQDFAIADQVLQMIREKRLNRNIQPINNMKEELQSMLIKGSPTIFYAGQNDFESGLYPYTDVTKKYHSPIFRTSDEAAIYLSQLAKKNGWNFIYKPHPLIVKLNKSYYDNLNKDNMIVVSDIDIHDLVDISDLTVTILSQTGYVSLIRNRPTLMLGYTQLRGKGCTYEAFTLEDIEATIKQALKNGLTDNQKQAFKKHVAQLLRYYLYDDLVKKDFSYGQSLDDCVKFLLKE